MLRHAPTVALCGGARNQVGLASIERPIDTMLNVLAWPAPTPYDVNPYLNLIYCAFVPPRARLLRFTPLMRHLPKADVFQIHWPEGIFKGRASRFPGVARLKAWRVLRTIDYIRSQGGLAVLTLHNSKPHARLSPTKQKLYDRFMASLAGRTDLFVALTNESLRHFQAGRASADRAAAIVIQHPHYRDVYPKPCDQAEARPQFGLPVDRRVVGLLGSVRRSKCVAAAITRFRSAATASDLLLVAGSCPEANLWSEIVAARDGDERVILRPGHLTDTELATAFSAIDICFVSQPDILNSGMAILSLSLDRPVVAFASGSMPGLRDMVGPKWMQLLDDEGAAPIDLADAMDALSGAKGQRCLPLDTLAPARLSRKLLSAFEAALDRARA